MNISFFHYLKNNTYSKKLGVISLIISITAVFLIILVIQKTQTYLQYAYSTVNPMPIISHNIPSYALPQSYPADWAINTDYNQIWRSGKLPAYLTYDLSRIPQANRSKIFLAWYNDTTYSYDPSLLNNTPYNIPSDYVIEANPAAGGSNPATGWVTLVKETGNKYHSRDYLLNLQGYNWIRLTVTKSYGSESNNDAGLKMDLFDASQGTNDSFIFYGDFNTTTTMLHNTINNTASFTQLINKQNPLHIPLQENAGEGFAWNKQWGTTQAVSYIPQWIKLFNGKYVGINFGTVDANNCIDPNSFYTNYRTMIDAVIQAGKIPLIPTIPFGKTTNIQTCAPSLNTKIAELYRTYPQIIHGPDFWTFFKNNQAMISDDKISFTEAGNAAYRQQWASQVASSIYANSPVSPTITQAPSPTSSLSITPTNTLTTTPTSMITGIQTPTATPVITKIPTITQGITNTPTPTPPAAGTNRYLYTVAEGSINVFDIDHGFNQIKTITLPQTSGNGVRGVAASPSTHMLYVSYGSDSGGPGKLLEYDLVKDQVVWTQVYPHGIDSMSITPDGKTIYMPDGELSSDGKWYVINAATGNETGAVIDTGSTTRDNGPHNTIVSLSGKHVYMGDRNYAHGGSNYFYQADTATNQITAKIGPFNSGIRPFTINAKETLVYTSVTGMLGFQVGDLTTGKVLYTVPLTKPQGANCSNGGATDPSHGISLSPDEKQLYVLDYTCNYVHAFDVSHVPSLAPQQIAAIPVSQFDPNQPNCTYDCLGDGWLLHSSDGRYVFVGDSGDVIDTAAKSVIAHIQSLYNTRIFIEIDWQNGIPAFTTTRSGLGYGGTIPAVPTPTNTVPTPSPTPCPSTSIISSIINFLTGANSCPSPTPTPSPAPSPTPTPMPVSSFPPLPVISRNAPAYASSPIYPATNANDSNYATYYRGSIPGWLAYNLSAVPKNKRSTVIVAWYNDPITYEYDHTIAGTLGYNNLGAYTIDVNAAPGGSSAPVNGWVTLVTVTGNTYHSRQHVINMTGYNWIRINVTASDGSGQNNSAMFNMDIHDASQGIFDDWIFYGDSITANIMHHSIINNTNNFSQLINASNPAYFPLQENGGIPYLLSTNGATNITKWLPLFPGKFVELSYGTNDANGQCQPAVFKQNYVFMIQAVLISGKTPVIPHIPWAPSTAVQSCGPQLNAVIDQLYASTPQIIKGPDLWSIFFNHPELFQDQLHPNAAGEVIYRNAWAQKMLQAVYNSSKSITPTPTPTTSITSIPTPTPTSGPTQSGVLPGEQIWKGIVSNYVFGTNLTGEWGTPNIEFTNTQKAPGTPNTLTQNLVRQSGFTLMRAFVPHHDFATGKEMTDAEIQAKLQTIQNTGAQCLGVLVSINPTNQQAGDTYSDLQFAQHVVSMWGKNCNMYEIGNESGLSPQNYTTMWNTFVLALKAINPNAKFIGPVTPQYYGTYITQFLQTIKSTNGPIPDAISYHWYPCWARTWVQCGVQTPAAAIISNAADVRSRIQAVLGHTLPIGISEWSADPGGNGTQNLAYTEPQMSQFITTALQAMIQAKLDFANIFDIQSNAAYGGLDMIDSHNTPRPYFNTFVNIIQQYSH